MDTKACLQAIDKWIHHVGLNPGDYSLSGIHDSLKHPSPNITAAFLYLSIKIILCRREPVRYQGPNELSQSPKSNAQRRVQQRVNLPCKANPVHSLDTVNNALHKGCPVCLLHHGNQKVQDSNYECAQCLACISPPECLEERADTGCDMLTHFDPREIFCELQHCVKNCVKPSRKQIP